MGKGLLVCYYFLIVGFFKGTVKDWQAMENNLVSFPSIAPTQLISVSLLVLFGRTHLLFQQFYYNQFCEDDCQSLSNKRSKKLMRTVTSPQKARMTISNSTKFIGKEWRQREMVHWQEQWQRNWKKMKAHKTTTSSRFNQAEKRDCCCRPFETYRNDVLEFIITIKTGNKATFKN